jgi:hypothetical protein
MTEKNELKKDGPIAPKNRVQSYSGSKNDKLSEIKKSEMQNTILIQFKENRKFDLHIGRNMITFLGRETLPVPKIWLQHKDWQNVKKYFIIRGA